MTENQRFIKPENLVYSALFIALGLLIPRIFHVMGPNAGKMFLPMYYSVVLAALLLPMRFTIPVAVCTPILSYILTGMPAIPMLYVLLCELVIYAIVANLLIRRYNPYITVVIASLTGRVVNVCTVLFLAHVIGLPIPFAKTPILMGTMIMSVPGIVLQIVLIPMIYKRVGQRIGIKGEKCDTGL
ncbi:MAG: hypothetical protein RSA90_06895 [Lachnospiraceae bacterium]